MACLVQAGQNYEGELIALIFKDLYRRRPIRVYVQPQHYQDILRDIKAIKMTDQCEKADIVIFDRSDMLPKTCLHRPLFATDYIGFRSQEMSIGAFYWRKGRPQLYLKKEAIEKWGLQIPPHLQRYAQ